MCLPPVGDAAGPHFALLGKLAASLDLACLSMGMSADYPAAVSLGATHIRPAQPYSVRAASHMHNTVGRDVRQNTPHNGARYGDTAKRRLEIIFFKMQKNGTARRRHGGHH